MTASTIKNPKKKLKKKLLLKKVYASCAACGCGGYVTITRKGTIKESRCPCCHCKEFIIHGSHPGRVISPAKLDEIKSRHRNWNSRIHQGQRYLYD